MMGGKTDKSGGVQGLTTGEAEELLQKYGRNEIKRERKINPLRMFLSQFTSPIILLLIAAAILSFSVNYLQHINYFDSVLIMVIISAAGIAGFVQDYKAERAVEALKKMASPIARVVRDGKEQEIASEGIVPGDLVIVYGGDLVPADSRIIDGGLEVDESILTGESSADRKHVGDEIFSNCGVYTGRATARVFATGMDTRVGEIASKMQEIEVEDTPFQGHMKRFTRKIVGMTSVIVILTFIVAFKKFGIFEAGLIAVSLAVAAIPEDLPAVITIALSMGAKNMVKRNALVRRLAITESIGSVDIICTDKTGTLTEGRMKVTDVWLPVDGGGLRDMAIKCCHYCNDSKEILKDGEEKWVGDETDVALKQFSLGSVRAGGKRIDEIPFTSERKMMSVVYELPEDPGKIIFSKGAPEVIVEKSGGCMSGEGPGRVVVKLDKGLRERILQKNEGLASRGYRVLALAYRDLRGESYKKGEGAGAVESNLVFIGLVVLSDPVRPEAKEAISECYDAGIRTIMITGDNPLTAEAIALEVGIKTGGITSGRELDAMDDKGLEACLRAGTNIFARTNPFHKLRILGALQKEGYVVSMTGDGVNDSLALKKADVGIAMGIKGTEVAKEASDIILLDDNFATIRNAVKEGRRIFDNIRKFVDYLLTCNIAEVVVVLLTTLFYNDIVLFPVQILWINLITDGLPALALSVDPARPDTMKKKPRRRGEGIINKKLALLVTGIGLKKSMVILATFFIVLPLGIDKARTTLFTGFIMYEFVRIGVIRYNEKLMSLRDWVANKFLVYSLILSLALQLFILYTPLGAYFNVVPLGLYEWGVIVAGTGVGFILGIAIAYVIDKLTKERY